MRILDVSGLKQEWTGLPSDRHVVDWGLEAKRASAGYRYASSVDLFGFPATFYNTASALPGLDESPGVGTYVFDLTGYDTYDLDVFLKTGLLDPRVAGETFPLDRRSLRSEMQP